MNFNHGNRLGIKLRVKPIRQAIALSDYLSILYEDAPKHIRNEPPRAHRHEVASRRVGHKERKFGAAS